MCGGEGDVVVGADEGAEKKKASVSQRRPKQKRMKKNIIVLFFLEVFLHLVGEDDFFLEGVGIGFGRANHTDHFCITFTSSGFEGSNNFLCHISYPYNYAGLL